MSSASWGRSTLNSRTKASKRSCCCRLLKPGGRVASFLRVRCMRSWRPFLEQLPPQHQPLTHMDDIRRLLTASCQPGTVNLHLAQAKCRLFPDIDRATAYREYGLE